MRIRCKLIALTLPFLLAACAAQPAAPAATPTPAAPTAAPTATPAPTAAPEPTPAPEPAGETLAYDELRLVAVGGSTPFGVMEGYFTVSQNGLWGLIRADGTELLPCRAAAPVANCGNGNHWMWNVSGMGWEEIDAISAELEEAGEPVLCQGHGAGSTIFFYDLDAPGRDIHALDPGALRVYISSDGPGSIVPVTDELWEHYGDRLPAFTAHEEGEEGDPRYPGDPVVTENADGSLDRYMYISREGNFYFVPNAQMAGFFYEEQLAPVQMPGGWVYVDRAGHTVTEGFYDPTYATGTRLYSDPPATEPFYAAPLQNGYAAVRRGDAWGLLDAAGTEVIPCEQAGVAWEGTTLWLKENGAWRQAELPL